MTSRTQASTASTDSFREKLRAVVRNDQQAVSPVIGVILLVAVTVVLAAVIAGFVFGIGDNLSQTAPNTDLEYRAGNMTDPATGDTVTAVSIWHDGGDTISEKLIVRFNKAPTDTLNGSPYVFQEESCCTEMYLYDVDTDPPGVDPTTNPGSVEAVYIDVGEKRRTGDNLLTMAYNTSQDISGTAVTVAWAADDGGQSAVIGEYTYQEDPS